MLLGVASGVDPILELKLPKIFKILPLGRGGDYLRSRGLASVVTGLVASGQCC